MLLKDGDKKGCIGINNQYEEKTQKRAKQL